jgi:hypothetical protein
MGAKQELLEKAEQEFDRFKAAIKDLDEAQMGQVWLGSWGVREILAHVTGWHREMIPALERVGRGEAPYPDGAYDDFDGWNAVRGRPQGLASADLSERWTPPTASY